MSLLIEMKIFDSRAAAGHFLGYVTQIRLYSGGGVADSFNKEVRRIAGDHPLGMSEIEEIAKQFLPTIKKS